MGSLVLVVGVDLFSGGGLGAFADGETRVAVKGFPLGEFTVADGYEIG